MKLKRKIFELLWSLINTLLNVFPSLTDSTYDMRKAQRVALLSYGSKVGDSVIMSFFVRELKKYYPNIYLAVGIQKNYKEIFDNNPYIDQTFVLPNSFLSIVLWLRKNKFDVILDIPFSNRKNLLAYYCAGPKKLITVQYTSPCRHFTYLQPVKDKHFSDIFVQALHLFGIKHPDLSYDLFLTHANKKCTDLFLVEKHLKEKHFVLFNPQASTLSRSLQGSKVCDIIKGLIRHNIPMVLLCHQLEYANTLPPNIPVFSTTSVMQTAALVAAASYILSVDTGIVHIADAYKKPMTILYSDVCVPGEAPRSEGYLTVWQPLHSPFHRLRTTWQVNDIPTEDIIQSVKMNFRV